MASLLIGRIVDWSLLGNIEQIDVTRDQFTLRGRMTIGDDQISKAKAVRDQLVGLMDSNEPFVPFRVKEDPTLDGMVKVTAASATIDPGALERGWFPWSISAARVPGGALPNVESPLIGGYRNNPNVPDTDVVPWHAVPAAALDYYDGTSVFQPDADVLATETGNINYYRMDDGIGRRVARYAVPPANWYDGAAYVEQAYPDGAYYKAIGRLMYSGLSSTGWRLGNSIVRIQPSATAGRLELQMWETETGWGAAHTFKLTADDGVSVYTVNRINTVSILKNSPEECRVRLTCGLSAGGINYPHRTVLDLKLRRGARMIECRWSTFGDNILGTVGPDPTEAGTELTELLGGITDTPDAQGNLVLIVSPTEGDFATGSSRFEILSTTPLTAWSFGLGIVQNGLFASAPWRFQDMMKEYLAPYGERMTVVGW